MSISYKYEICLIVASVVIIYSNTLNAPFVFDDFGNILNNNAVKDIYKLISYSIDDIHENLRIFVITRHIGYLSFAINYAIGGNEPLTYHIVNIIIHIVNSILILEIVRITLLKTLIAHNINVSSGSLSFLPLLISFLFAVHPIQTQAVTYIVQRFTSLATLFYLLALLLYVYWRVRISDLRRPFFYLLALLSTICAMKTKEITFTLPVMMLLYDVAFIRDKFKNTIVYLLPFIFCMAIIPLTLISLSSLQDGLNASNHFNISMWQYLFTQITVIVKYIGLLILPVNQAVDYAYPLYKSFFEIRVILSFLLITVLFLSGLYMKFNNKINPLLKVSGFGILWFFITISVESSIIPIADYIFEHRLYLPSIGFFIFVTSIFYLIYIKSPKGIQKQLILFAIFIIVILGIATYNRNEVWTEEERLWKDNITKQPHKGRAYRSLSYYYKRLSNEKKAIEVLEIGYNIVPEDYLLSKELAVAYISNKEYEKAFSLLNEILVRYPHNKSQICVYLGILFLHENQLKRAHDMFLSALNNKQYSYDIWLNLSRVLFKQCQLDKALIFSKVALINKPNDLETLSFIAILLEKMNMFKESQYYYRLMLKADPDFINNLILSGANQLMSNRILSAKSYFSLATKIDPNSSEAFYFLGLTEFKLGNFEEAKSHFYKSLELKTEYLHFAHYFLAKIYQKQGDKENAIKHIKKCIEAKPDYELAQKTLKDLDSN